MQNTYSKGGLVLDISCQKLQETGRDIIRDKSRHMNHGMCMNGTDIIQTKEGICALSFDGVDDYVDCGSGASLAPEKLTIEFWMYPKVVNASKYIICKATDTGYARDYTLILESNGEMNFWFGENSNSYVSLNSSAISANQWIHIVALRDGSNARFYLNGVEDTSKAYSFTPTDKGHTLKLGDLNAIAANYFNGLIDEVRIYNRALSLEEVRGNMFASKRYKYMRGVQKCGVQ